MRIILILIFISFNALADDSKVYFSFGGGCGNPETLKKFKKELEESALKNGHKVLSSFHESEQPTNNESSPGNKNHFESQLKQVIKDFKEKDCQVENCQFVLNLTAHGYPGDNREASTYGFPQFSTRKHGLCLANDQKYETQNLRPFLEELKKQGVKVGIIDESCYGGSSVGAFSDLACVVTATSSIIPHSASHSSNSFSTSHQKLSDEGSKQVSLENMMVQQLLKTSSVGGINNLPMVGMPKMSKTLQELNKASDVLSYKQSQKFTGEVIRKLPTMSLEDFREKLHSCSLFYKKTKGKPVEVLEKESWYQDFTEDKFLFDFCTKINFNKSHARKYDGLVWNKKEKQIYREGLICESKYFSSQRLFEDLSVELEDYIQTSLNDSKASLPSGSEVDKYLNSLKANLASYDFNCRFDIRQFIKERPQFAYEMGISKTTKESDIQKKFKTSMITPFLNSTNDNVENCYKSCRSVLKNIHFVKSTKHDHLLASMCLNRLKAFQVIIDKVKAEKSKANHSLCSQIQI